MADGSLSVRVVSPERTVFEGRAASLVAPAWDGQVGILPGHAPFIALLGDGELSVDAVGGGSERWYVAGGVLKVEADVVTVLTEFARSERPPEGPPPTVTVYRPEDFLETSPGNPLV